MKHITNYEVKVNGVWYRLIGQSEDGLVAWGMSITGEERRIPNWKDKDIREVPRHGN